MDGWITIGTELDKTQLEKDLKDSERMLKRYEREAERLTKTKAKVEVDLKGYYETKKLIEENTNSALQYAQSEAEVNHQLDIEKANLKKLDEAYAKQLNTLNEINKSLEENSYNQSLIRTKVGETTNELQKQQNIEDIKNGIKDIGKGVDKTTKKISKWALALVGIRTALSILSRSFNTLLEYNDDLAQKVSDIRLSLATLLEPVIVRIVDLVYLLLQYLNLLSTAWFGINMFSRASELSANKMAKNLASGAGSAKEIKKQLAGFDEMNVLQDQTSSGGGGGASSPGYSLKDLEGPIPKWMEWLIKNGPEILSLIAGITGGLILMRVLGLDPLTTVGVVLLIAGIVEAIQGLILYLQDPSFDNFGRIIIGIGVALVGLGIIIGNVPLIVAGAIVAILGLIVKYWDEIKDFFGGIFKWLDEQIEDAYKRGDGFLVGAYITIKNWLLLVFNIVNDYLESAKKLLDGIIEFVKGVFTGDWAKAWEGIKKIGSACLDYYMLLFKNFWEYTKVTLSNVWNALLDLWNSIKSKFQGIATTIGEVISGAIKGAINSVFWLIEQNINGFIRSINGIISIINALPGVSLSKLSLISLPRLATGAIINQPGRGVPVGGAIAGEAGREGILPLTDERAMAMLGREIGKWITLNAEIPVSIGNRQIARTIREVMLESDFQYNR